MFQDCKQTAGKVEKSLLVTNDRFVADSFTSFFALQGYLLQTCESTVAAFEFLAEQLFDLVLIDSDLTDKSHLDFCCRLRGLYPMLGLILLVDYGECPSAQAAFTAGIDDWIEKPLGIYSIERVIFQLLKKRQMTATAEA